ncbi:MAG: ABC transporter ATP-binding protein [Pseudomonadota bacterium]
MMVDDVVIRTRGLGKKYVIGHKAIGRVPTLRDAIACAASNFGRLTYDLLRGKPLIAGDEFEEFWALRDVDFEIKRGEVVGIIGRNGAGKSTLLKVLSRITEPSEGRVEIRGRVASLLEVGTGFHPELTGRENIFLNGAILGMSRAEIRQKFPEIVAFAEVERFLDTPVKRYSSGMYVRLAFAVAAFLEPEILIIDEVLAVGDAEFQKKSLGKMDDVAKSGKTVLFVSHNMAAIKSLCSSAIYLEDGQVAYQGRTDDALAIYLDRKTKGPPRKDIDVSQDGLKIAQAVISREEGSSEPKYVIEIDFVATCAGSLRECTVNIFSVLGTRIAIVDPRESGSLPFSYGAGQFSLRIEIDSLPFVEGDYQISLWLVTPDFTGLVESVIEFSVERSGGAREFASYSPDLRGHVELAARISII